MDKISYAIGLSMGQNLMGSGVTSLEYADLAAGIKDVLEKNQPQISYQEAQQVLGKFFSELGARQRMRVLLNFFSSDKKGDSDANKDTIVPVVLACLNMSRRKEGALMVIERNQALNEIVATGDLIDANVNQRLIENIFFKNSPLHDGAMIISSHRIKAAGCILPVAHNQDIPKELGLRHRAALGMSQNSDAIVVIVSEETGGISVAINGKFQLLLSAEKLESILTEELRNEK